MALRYHVPLTGQFYYSGRVGPKHWLPRSRHAGPGICDFMMKWFVIYSSVVFFGAGGCVTVEGGAFGSDRYV